MEIETKQAVKDVGYVIVGAVVILIALSLIAIVLKIIVSFVLSIVELGESNIDLNVREYPFTTMFVFISSVVLLTMVLHLCRSIGIDTMNDLVHSRMYHRVYEKVHKIYRLAEGLRAEDGKQGE